MTSHEPIHISERGYALVAGLSLIFMAAIAGFSYGYVINTLILPNDTAQTIANIKTSEGLFRAGIFGFVCILVLDVISAWGLYHVLKPVSKSISGLAAVLRLVYAPVFGIAFLCLIFVLQLVDSTVIEQTTKLAQCIIFLRGFSAMWSLSLIIFSVHLFVLGVLVVKSGTIPKIFGILVVIAALCYLINDSANLLFAQYAIYKPRVETFLSAPMAIGELALAIWLVAKGGKAQKT